MVWADGILLTWSGFQSRPDGTAFGAGDGLAWRPDLHGTPSTGADTAPRETTVVPAVDEPTTTEIADPSPTTPSQPVPATEHQLQVLADAFLMPGRPELRDVPGGQTVTIGSRSLVVNVPLAGIWQYHDLDALSLPFAPAVSGEMQARALLANLSIDAQGQVATFKPSGTGTEVDLAGCSMLFAEAGQIAYAIGPLAAIG